MTKKTALITGITGQDGAYLARFLLKKNYKVIGLERRSARSFNWRLEKLNINDKVIIEDTDIKEINNLIRIFDKYKVDEVYNLAAQSFVYSSFQNPIETSLVNSIGTLNLLEIIRNKKNKIKFYQASTSEMFGESKSIKQDEKTLFHPRSPYATSKTFAHYSVQNYREAYNLHAVSGILFNHESPLRGEEFITRKITLGLSKIVLKKQKNLKIGNLYAKRDWGYADDYVEAMWKMLQSKKPDDYVIATGKNHSIKQFINESIKALKLKTKWVGKGLNEKLINTENNKAIIVIDKKFFRPTEVNILKGNYQKAKRELKWKPKTNFSKLVKMMIASDLEYVKNLDKN
ncbi:GDP-mannose 4,6-dehydratase [Candidatus Pelagibacter sp. RS40]|uniref:GDP-mannose 4,6-dehydratase n=1 Tax=Candidatus Pelagibacter sp. RS40 TaxID=1977865 RepID=UPI000A14659B|nr:GDP-mannose 4,6-dehydratase [Candidatus Pelagibacter sp. RS40]ARJ49536.1 GDP-mannose 4,6-dehydratase [Candidatus Pelagibacter sp. RS40]